MPIVGVLKRCLDEQMGESLTERQFRDLCFEFGIELDDVTSEQDLAKREKGAEAAEGLSTETIYKIEVPANRYDLLCVEGIARALRTFRGKEKAPLYKSITPKSPIQFIQKPETKSVRGYIVGCILRGINFTQEIYDSFIDCQDKLHQGIGRKRTLVAIGTHDLDTVKPPFTYEALPFRDIKFVPLGETKTFNVAELFAHYRDEKTHSHIKPYTDITKDSPVHPVIYDAERRVMSLPPIINSELSKLSLKTKNIFIDVTGTDLTKVSTALSMLVAMFSQYCKQPFTAECVELVDGKTKELYPKLEDMKFTTSSAYINRGIGINLPAKEITKILEKTGLRAFEKENKENKENNLEVYVPPTRPDIIHPCDIMEDVAIAYGYNKIPKTIPIMGTTGKELKVNKLSDLLRGVCAEAGYLEVLNWALVSRKENYDFLNRKDPGHEAVVLDKPKTKEFELVRTNLIGSLFKVLTASKGHPLPIKIFEVGDVSFITSTRDVGAQNERHLAAVHSGKTSGLERIHAFVDRIMLMNRIRFYGDLTDEEKKQLSFDPFEKKEQKQKQNNNGEEEFSELLTKEEEQVLKENKYEKKKRTYVYHYEDSDDETFFPGRRAYVYLNNIKIGTFGIVHPLVCKNFDIVHPTSALELNIEILLSIE